MLPIYTPDHSTNQAEPPKPILDDSLTSQEPSNMERFCHKSIHVITSSTLFFDIGIIVLSTYPPEHLDYLRIKKLIFNYGQELSCYAAGLCLALILFTISLKKRRHRFKLMSYPVSFCWCFAINILIIIFYCYSVENPNSARQ